MNLLSFARLPFLLTLLFTLPAHAKISSNHKGGAVVIGETSISCDADIKGGLRWNDSEKTHEMCDGTAWKKLLATGGTGDPSLPSPDAGYFVITSGTWNGDLRTAGAGVDGLDGANKLCLSDLQNNDWMGKADADSRGLVTAAKVRAFICPNLSQTCQNALPNTTYHFAVSGDNAKGGALFTTDETGRGPGNNQNWAGTNYFDGEKSYWTGRETGSTTLWPLIAGWDSYRSCSSWTSTNPGGNAHTGVSNRINTERWKADQACGVARNLICMVHP